MTKEDINKILSSALDALQTLDDVLKMPETTITRDASIKRFEYNFELSWKIIKRFAQLEGEECNSPRSAFRLAFKLGWVEDDLLWMDMLDDRNQTAHTYRESTAKSVYINLARYKKALEQLYIKLKELDI